MVDKRTLEEDRPGTENRTQKPPSPVFYYLGVLRRRIWIILPVLLVFATLGLIKAFRAPRIYRARAQMLVERHLPSLMQFEDRFKGGYGWDPDYYRTQTELVRSRGVMELALEQPGIREVMGLAARDPAVSEDGTSGQVATNTVPATPEDPDVVRGPGVVRRTMLALLGGQPAEPPEDWEILRSQVMAIHMTDTKFIRVEVVSGNPRRAAMVANAAADSFRKYHEQRQREYLVGGKDALEEQKQKQMKALAEAEDAMQRFRETAQGVSVDTSRVDTPAMDRLVRINERMTKVQLERIDLTSHLVVMREASKEGPELSEESDARLFALPVIQNNPTLVESRKALADVQKELAVLSETYGAEHPLLQSAQGKVALLGNQFRTALSEVIQAHENRLRVLTDQEKTLKKEYDEQKGVTVDLAKEGFEMERLRNAVSRNRDLLETITKRMREVDISKDLVRTNVDITDKASVPRTPLSAGKQRTVLFSILMGLLVGTGLAFLVENIDDTIKTPEDLREHLGVPFLGFIPAMEIESDGKPDPAKGNGKLSRRNDPEVRRRGAITLSEPVSSIAEAYRNIRTNLVYSRPGDDIKTVAFSSCRPEEGKTTTTTNLALSLAQTGKRVLLVDGDLHRPMTHRIMDLDTDVGLTSVLVGEAQWKDAVRPVVIGDGKVQDNLQMLAAGPESPNPSELLGSTAMRDLMAELREQYDWVLIDTPPILFVSDACLLGALCDGVIMVVKAGSATRSLLARAREQLDGVHAHLFGSILNNVTVSRLGRTYSYYSYHGYSRYAKDYHRSYYSRSSRNDGDGS